MNNATPTRSEKLRIIHSLSEDQLRHDVLIPIFQNMTQYLHVDETHGFAELGKDIVLVERDALGDFSYTAVVLKAKTLSNATSNRSEHDLVANVSNQIVMCIGSKYACPIQKRKVTFNKIVVMTSQHVSERVMKELIEVAKQHNFANVVFKRDEDIINWTDQYLPSFYSTENGALASYLDQLRDRCNRLDSLERIPSYSGGIRSMQDIFITPPLQQFKPSTGANGKVAQSTLRRLIFERKHALLLAPGGAGKSTLLRAQVEDLIQTKSHGHATLIPILVKATELTVDKDMSLRGRIQAALQRQGLVDEGIKAVFNESRFEPVVLIDSLDELGDINLQKELIAEIREFSLTYKRCKIVIASRPTGVIDIPGFRTWLLSPFDRKMTTLFFEKWFAERPEIKERVLQDFQNHDLLDKVPSTPIVLTLMAVLVEQRAEVELPANLSELYQMFTDLLLGKWSIDRRVNTMFGANVKSYLVGEIAHALHRDKLTSLPGDIVRDLVANTLLRKGWPYDSDEVFSELLQGESLLYRSDTGEVGFRHASFQEFFVANKIKDDHVSPEDITQLFLDPWWQTVVYFYAGLKRENNVLLPLISAHVTSRDIKEFWPAFWAFGYLLQASYATDLEVRQACLIEQVRQFSRAVDASVQNPDLNQFPSESIGYMVLMILFITREYYASRFQGELYQKVLQDLKDGRVQTFQERLELVLAAFLINSEKRAEALIDIYDSIKNDTLLTVAVDFEVNRLLGGDPVQAKQLSSLANRLRRNIQRKPQLVRKYLTRPKTSIIKQNGSHD